MANFGTLRHAYRTLIKPSTSALVSSIFLTRCSPKGPQHHSSKILRSAWGFLSNPARSRWRRAQSLMPPRQPYVLNRKILLNTAAKIPPYVPQNFGGSKRTFWNQFELTSCEESTKCSRSPRNIPSRRVRLFTCEHRNLQSLSLWQVAFDDKAPGRFEA
jgi:hypothetical protein